MDGLWNVVTTVLWILFWGFVLLLIFSPAIQRRGLASMRAQRLLAFQQQRGSRVILLIHRQESVSFLGLPIARYIDIDDSEAILRAIRLTPTDVPLDLIVHTPGGLVLAAEQIAHALVRHQAPVTIFVPHYAMSGGTLLALASDQIIMDPNAVLGPVDPQLGGVAAVSILDAVERKPVAAVSDQTLMMADMARKALAQVRALVIDLQLANGIEPARAAMVADVLATGRVTHDYPINFEKAQALGLPVSSDLPDDVHALMSLYQQPSNRRPSVSYIPMPYGQEGSPGSRPPTAPPR